MRNFVLTSSSVTDGHPDKLCDRISDAILDAHLALDPASLVQAECAIASGIVFLAVRANSAAHVDLPAVVRDLVEETGYDDPDFNPRNVTVLSAATPGVAARQFEENVTRPAVETVSATVFGYACRHTPEMLPLSIVLAHRLAQRLRDVRMRGEIPMLHPDGQVQVGVRYRGRMPECIESIALFSALSSQARADDQLSAKLHELVLRPVLEQIETPLSPDAQIVINPQNSVSIGGPARHAGLTGRKNDIDTYGGYSRHGGAALCGKDPSRIDRTGAYLARYAAKNVVAAGLAQECEVQISYAIGRFEPVSVEIDTFDSSTVPEAEILRALRSVIDFSVGSIERTFRLADLPKANQGRFFARLAAFGHFGRPELDLPWEATDKADALKERLL
ncbi:MAG: methionine adenosyltransferase [Hyphomicrobium sp.]|nr:methionine adenosyltransferase [Hyphomicrobium sp.]